MKQTTTRFNKVRIGSDCRIRNLNPIRGFDEESDEDDDVIEVFGAPAASAKSVTEGQ